MLEENSCLLASIFTGIGASATQKLFFFFFMRSFLKGVLEKTHGENNRDPGLSMRSHAYLFMEKENEAEEIKNINQSFQSDNKRFWREFTVYLIEK